MKWLILAERLERKPETAILAKVAKGMQAIEDAETDYPDYLDSDEVFRLFETVAEQEARK